MQAYVKLATWAAENGHMMFPSRPKHHEPWPKLVMPCTAYTHLSKSHQIASAGHRLGVVWTKGFQELSVIEAKERHLVAIVYMHMWIYIIR